MMTVTSFSTHFPTALFIIADTIEIKNMQLITQIVIRKSFVLTKWGSKPGREA